MGRMCGFASRGTRCDSFNKTKSLSSKTSLNLGWMWLITSMKIENIDNLKIENGTLGGCGFPRCPSSTSPLLQSQICPFSSTRPVRSDDSHDDLDNDYEIKNDSAADDDDKNTEIKMTKPMVAQWENVEKILEIQKYQKTIL